MSATTAIVTIGKYSMFYASIVELHLLVLGAEHEIVGWAP